MKTTKTKDEFLIFGSPLLGREEIDAVIECLESGWIGTGPRVARFEQEFCQYKSGWGHPVAVNSCTAALHLSLIAAGIGPGDEVITTPMTFCASVNAIIHAGGTPVLADVDPRTMNIDAESIESRITPATRALVIVHFAGRPCDMGAIMDIARRHDLKVIEDCAHAIETTWQGQHAGTFGDFGCFSFYVTKNVITGEGGMILAREEDAAGRLKTLALHGMSRDAWKRFGDEGFKHYQVVECGFKYNMMDLQAAIGIHQLQRVEHNYPIRQKIWDEYQAAFADLPVTCPVELEPGSRHALHLYTLLIDADRCGISRDEFLDKMTEQGIGTGVHYLSVADHPFYQDTFGWQPDDVPHATRIGQQTVSLPLSAKMTDEDVERVIRSVRSLLTSKTASK